ncbi:MAG: CARDB domain-containing protein, partial [Sedimentisphaerales bacterium]|nr:CARDB domain-containing protein [Sedimentisphaerales bacterium]
NGRLWWDEADIIFDADEPWSPFSYSSNLWPYKGPYRPFVTTAVHEMGHALGLNHENRFYNVMGEDWTHVHTDESKTAGYAGSDATQGALFLYGKSAKYGWKEDLAVTHWKYAKKGGEYSKHTPTVMYLSDAVTKANAEELDGFSLYLVRPGDIYNAEFTYENTGYSGQPNVKVAWFISTNKAISTFDRMIGSTQINLPAGAVWTTTVSLTIPSDLKAGMIYFLGVIVDYQNNIGEFNEANNSTFLQIKAVNL